MIIRNVSRDDLNRAMDAVNAMYDDNVMFKDIWKKGKSRGGGDTYNVSLKVKNGVVQKGLQGKGIGGKLIEKVVDQSIKQGAKVLAADITFDNIKSKKMAKKAGFNPVSRFCWKKGKEPADIVHFVLYPPEANNKCTSP